MASPRITEEQLLQALRELGAVSSETAVTTRKVAQHLGETTSYIRDRLDISVWDGRKYWRKREPAVIGWRQNGGPNYWWAI